MMVSIMKEFWQEEKQKACELHNQSAKRTDSLNQFSQVNVHQRRFAAATDASAKCAIAHEQADDS